MPALAAAAAGLAILAAAPATAPPPLPGVDHGARVAERHCSICHAVGPTGRSRNLAAPPFRGLARRYSSLSLEQALKRVSTQGHFEMRARDISQADARDLAAYIESLAPPK